MNSLIQEAEMNETQLYSPLSDLRPIHSATHQFTIQLTELCITADQHMIIFLGILNIQYAQQDSTDAIVYTLVQERREKYINNRACSSCTILQIVRKELNLRQIQNEQHVRVSSPKPLLFKPHSSTQLCTGCPF